MSLFKARRLVHDRYRPKIGRNCLGRSELKKMNEILKPSHRRGKLAFVQGSGSFGDGCEDLFLHPDRKLGKLAALGEIEGSANRLSTSKTDLRYLLYC